MKTWLLFGAVLGAGVLVTPAFADVLTSRVVNWNAKTHQLTLSDMSQFNLDPTKVALPSTFTPGETVEIVYASDEDGVLAVHSVKTTPAETVDTEDDD